MAGMTHEAAVSATVEHYTPLWLFNTLGLYFDLDPCHPARRLWWVPVDRTYCKADNGLVQPWKGRIWLNPPYGSPEAKCGPNCTKKRCAERGWHAEEDIPGMDSWLERMHLHPERDGMALLHARTDPEWFHDYVAQADAVLFLRKRVQFVDETGKPPLGKNGKPGTPGCGQMLVAWGPDCVASLARQPRTFGAFFEGGSARGKP